MSARIDFAALRALADAATPGPWSHADTARSGGIDYALVLGGGDNRRIALSIGANDAALVASARTAVPALLDYAEQRDADVARLQGQLARAAEYATNMRSNFLAWHETSAGELAIIKAQRDTDLAAISQAFGFDAPQSLDLLAVHARSMVAYGEVPALRADVASLQAQLATAHDTRRALSKAIEEALALLPSCYMLDVAHALQSATLDKVQAILAGTMPTPIVDRGEVAPMAGHLYKCATTFDPTHRCTCNDPEGGAFR